MDRSDVITLISEAYEQDEYGVWRNTGHYLRDENGQIMTDEEGKPIRIGAEREVYAQVDSITRSEFFDAGRNGLNPEFKMTMFFYDYHGERIVKYNGLVYAVYRTYHGRNDTIELYVERKGGTNGSS